MENYLYYPQSDSSSNLVSQFHDLPKKKKCPVLIYNAKEELFTGSGWVKLISDADEFQGYQY